MRKIVTKLLSWLMTLVVIIGLVGVMPARKVEAAVYYPAIDYSSRAGANRIYQQRSGDCAVASIASIEAYHKGTTSGVYDLVYSKNGYGVYINSWAAMGYEVKNFTLQNLYDGLKGGPCIIHRSGHYSVVVAYEGNQTQLELSGFKVMEVTGYNRYDGAIGYPTAWINAYNSAIKVPLDVWGSYSGASIENMIVRTTGMVQGDSAENVNSVFPLVDGGIYKIRNVNSGLLIDIPGGTNENSAELQQWDDGGSAHEFKAIRRDDGYVFKSVQNGKVWDIYMGYSTEGASLTQYDYNDTAAQHYKLVNRGNGRYSIHPACSNRALDVVSYSTENGARIKQYDYHGGNNQLWTFELKDEEAPVVSNIQILNLSGDGYKVTCTATDNVGVTKVCFPTWTEVNGQDDLANDWGNTTIGTYEGGNTYSYLVKVSDHNNEGGRYITHVYAYDAAGNYTSQGVTVDVVRTVPLESFSLNASTLNLNINQIQTLAVQSYVPANTTADKTASWTSSDSSVASVDANGAVRGVKNGTAVITCTIAGKAQTCQVNVSDYVEQNYSDWMETLPTEVTNHPTLYQVEQRIQYRSQTKSETTSMTPNLAGWTVSNEWWGDWQSCGADVTGTSTREVRTEQQYVKTQYAYNHYHNYSTGRLSPVQYSAQWVYEETGWLDYALTVYGTSNAGGNMYRGIAALGPCGCKDCWYNQSTRDVYNTLYYYRDKYFQYYQWSGWSGWSDQAITASSNVNVETRKLYRYRYVGPQIISQPADQIADSGETVVFEITANGQELTYQWQISVDYGKTWSNLEDTETSVNVLKVNATWDKDSAQFRCIIKDKNGNELISDVAKLTIRYIPVSILKQPKSREVEEGKTATFTVRAEGSGLSYQWQVSRNAGKTWSNTSQSGSKTETLKMTATEGRDGYQFRCVVTDGKGKSAITKAVGLSISGGVKITSQPESQEVKEGESVSFKVGATGSGLSYQWQVSRNDGKTWSNTSQSGNKTNTLKMAATESRNGYQFRCVVTDENGNSVTTEAAKLSVISGVKITSQPESQEVKEGETVSFTVGATGSGLSYQWQVSRNAGKSWSNTSQSGNKTNTLKMAATESRNGYQFRCVVTDENENIVTTEVAKLSVIGGVKITSQPESQEVKEGESVSFKVGATGSGLSYQWQVSRNAGKSWSNTSQSGNKTNTLKMAATEGRNGYQFRCVVTDENGDSVATEAARLSVISGVKITSQPESQEVKEGETVGFTVGATGSGLSYQWQVSRNDGQTWANTSQSGNKTETLKMSATEGRDGYLFRCVVTDEKGKSATTEAVRLSVIGGVKTTNQSENQEIEKEESVIFTVEVPSETEHEYEVTSIVDETSTEGGDTGMVNETQATGQEDGENTQESSMISEEENDSDNAYDSTNDGE